MNDLFDHKLFLAPMAGVNDPVFRALCRRMGASLTFTEMISAKGLSYGNKKTHRMIASLPEDTPFAVQLFGNEPAVMAEEAGALERELQEDLALLDINMGCPARKVTSTGSGAALLQNPVCAQRVVSAVASSVSVPVTVKIRLISATDLSETLRFAELLASAGAAAITIHGRTTEQFYRGKAQQEIVSLLAQKLSVPVLASGDVFTPEDITTYFEAGASSVMIARGAQGNPWIFAGYRPELDEVLAVAREHTQRLAEWDPPRLVWMRRHLSWYFKGRPHALQVRRALHTATTLDEYLTLLDEYSDAANK